MHVLILFKLLTTAKHVILHSCRHGDQCSETGDGRTPSTVNQRRVERLETSSPPRAGTTWREVSRVRMGGDKRPCHVRQWANAATRKSCFLHQTQCGRPISPQLPREPKTRGKYEGKSARTEVLMTRRRDISAALLFTLSNQNGGPVYGTKEVPREEGPFCPVTTNPFLLLIRMIIE